MNFVEWMILLGITILAGLGIEDGLEKGYYGQIVMAVLTWIGVLLAIIKHHRSREIPGKLAETNQTAFKAGKTLIASMGDGYRYKISKEEGWMLENGNFFRDGVGVGIQWCEVVR